MFWGFFPLKRKIGEISNTKETNVEPQKGIFFFNFFRKMTPPESSKSENVPFLELKQTKKISLK